MDIGIKITAVIIITILVYREIIKSASKQSAHTDHPKSKASFISLIMVGMSVGAFVYAGMSISFIETRDLRPYRQNTSPEMVSMFDKGVIELNGMFIKTNLAKTGELKSLSERLTQGCNGDDGCEVQELLDYVTHIPYKTDYTSRNAKAVIKTNWGDCDDKSNLFASLLNEKGLDYKFVYVPHHVFVVVHLDDTSVLPFLNAKLIIDGKNYYYAETTSSGSRIGEFNGQFPSSFEGIYDIRKNESIDLNRVKFRLV